MHKIHVVGIGPGGADYITPAAVRAIAAADIVIAGKRNCASLDLEGKMVVEIGRDLEKILPHIRENSEDKKIAVAVSGDPGFYSILGFLKKHIPRERIECIPGISPVMYFFAKIGMTWEDAWLGSLHGRDEDIVARVKEFRTVAYLTDPEHSYGSIARTLSAGGLGSRMIYAGLDLSYETERIVSGLAADLAGVHSAENLCVVVINDEMA